LTILCISVIIVLSFKEERLYDTKARN
jgi:hypothetical protein